MDIDSYHKDCQPVPSPTDLGQDSIETMTPDTSLARTRREVVALNGFMFDSSVLRDTDDEV